MTGRRRALLMGNAAYTADPKLPDLACPLNDVAGLAEVLRDPAIGDFEAVATLCDASSAEARRALVGFLRAAEPRDTVLFYYSGHGKLDDNFALHLCTSDSEVDLLEATAVRMGFVHDLLRKCRAEKSVLLLDCCYSGAAKGARARGNVDDQLKLAVRGTGTYLLTASDAIETAQEKEGARYGVFTGHVIEGLLDGEADREGRGFITMDDLYDYVVRAVRADSPQRPNREVGGFGDIVIARSGRDARRDRARDAVQMLFARAAAGDLDPTIAAAADVVARKRPSEHSETEAAIDAALGELLADRITLGVFVTAYWRAQVRPEPEPAGDARPRAEAPVEVTERGTEGAAGEPEATRPGNPWVKAAGTARPLFAGFAARTGGGAADSPLGRLLGLLGRPVWFRLLTPLLIALVLIAAFADSVETYGTVHPSVGLVSALGLVGLATNFGAFRDRFGVIGYVTNALALMVAGLMLTAAFASG